MDWKIVWTARATTDLRQIFDFISEANPTAAAKVVDAIVDRVELLKVLPRMGRLYTTINEMEVRQMVSGMYRIFYSVEDDKECVEVLTVWHGARQEPDLSQ